jgi:Family of unknown function (DUF6326)
MLDEPRVHVKAKLAAIWASATLCYLYGDFIAFYSPGALRMISDGTIGPLQITQSLLLGIAVIMAFPAVMVVLSLILPATWSRWVNIVAGTIYTAIMVITMVGAWAGNQYFYIYLGLVEVALTSCAVWYAVKWPVQTSSLMREYAPSPQAAPGQ